jgi:2-C-methyl-D-erythritol 4-phosphate cytidylyltransferase
MHAFILLAAGGGSRMRGVLDDKVLAPLAGRPALLRCLDAVLASHLPGPILVVVRDEAQRLRIERMLDELPGAAARVQWVHGGKERADSVRHALARVPESFELVFIHDAARPLLRPDVLQALAERARRDGSAILAHRVTDTIKEVPEPDRGRAGSEATPLRTPDRSRLWAMETPQVFQTSRIKSAYSATTGLAITDDASALELAGQRISLLENPHPNPKLTTPADLLYVEYLLKQYPPKICCR